MQIAGFDWDDSNRSKCQKHGVSQAAIESVFSGSIAVLPDPLHSKSEERFKAIGKSDNGRWIFLVFTLRTRTRQAIRAADQRALHAQEGSGAL